MKILDLFGETVKNRPEAVAIRFGDRRMTYGDLNRKSAALASILHARGTRKGDVVAVLIGNCLELPIAWLAVIKLGAVLVPFDPAWPDERTKQGLDRIGARTVLADRNVPADIVTRADVVVASYEELDSSDDGITFERPAADDLVYGFFTSGSTGQPKCALNYHRGLMNRFCYMTRHFRACESKTVLLNSRHVFDSAVWQLLWPLTIGGDVVIPAQAGHLDLMKTVDTIHRYSVTMTDFVPSIFNVLTELAQSDPTVAAKLAPLRWLLIGGEEINGKAVAKFRRLLPDIRLTNTYGPTEAAIGMIFHDIGEHDTVEIPLGAPIDNTFVAILDDDLRVVPVGQIGEICISGDCLGAGYLNDPEKTGTAFIDNPLPAIPYGKLYRTGDLGRQDRDGRIHFAGRVDTQVKVNGVRIELSEIEHALLRHEAVAEAVVLAVGERPQDRKRLCAVVVPRAEVSAGRLKSHLSMLLPEYMIPSEILLLPALPLTMNGKADRAALAASLRRPPNPAAAAPRELSQLETQLLHHFRCALANCHIGVDDDFFQQGGDSLSALEAILAINADVAVDLQLADIYAFPSVRKLAQSLIQAATIHRTKTRGNWQADAILADGFSVPAPSRTTPPEAILLTGATGFLGAHVLSALLQSTSARVTALVRAADQSAAFQRCRSALERYDLWDDSFLDNLSILNGDLSKPKLGAPDAVWKDMTRNMHSIVHCGAMVDFLRSYDEHRPHNVMGTIELIRLATTHCKKHLHYISTLSVFDVRELEQAGPLIADFDARMLTHRELSGYVQSKLIGEHFVRKLQARGLETHVYKLGEVGPSLTTGAPNDRSFLTMLLKSCVQLGIYPKIPLSFECAPVDAIANVVARCVSAGIAAGGSLHVFQQEPLSFDQVVDAMSAAGIALHPVSYAAFLEALEQRSLVRGAARELKLLRILLSRYSDCEALAADFSEAHWSFGQEGFDKLIQNNGIGFPKIDEVALVQAVIGRSSAAPPMARLHG